VRPIVSGLLFEPRDTGETTRQGADIVFPIGLGPQAGTQTLNITALPNMSSTLRPNAALLESYAKKFAHTRITETIEMRVDTLDALVRQEGVRVDAIKVDTQGSELGILQGAVECLSSSVVMAEVEVSFFQRYENQATLCDIAAFMGDHGFELVELYRLKRYRRANFSGIGNMSFGKGQRAGRLAYGDALFMLREDRLRGRIGAAGPAEAEATALKAVLAMLIYGKPDMAAQLFDQHREAIRDPWRANLGQWLGKLGKRRTGSGVLHHVFDYLARHV
jgi:FkbM family methyltransferase